MDEEEKTAKVIALMRHAEGPVKPQKPPPMLAKMVIINGGWHQYAPPRKEVVVIIRPEVISKAQKAALVALRDQWVQLHNTIKARQITRARARKAINARVRVTDHRLIPAACYADLVRWIAGKIAALRCPKPPLAGKPGHYEPGSAPADGPPRDANQAPDLTPRSLYLVMPPNPARSVPTNGRTPGISTLNPCVLCQTQNAGNFYPQPRKPLPHRPSSSTTPTTPALRRVPTAPLPHIMAEQT
jgi:hypothetical protein